MTYKQFLNTTTDEAKLAIFLFNFSASFYSGQLKGICEGDEDDECRDHCSVCIAELLNKEMDEKLLERELYKRDDI